MQKGYVQIYTGNGKGKTTAAVGLAVRAAGSGLTVKFIQFLKGSSSAETKILESVPEINFYRVSDVNKRFWHLSEQEKLHMKEQTQLAMKQVQDWGKTGAADLLILDEAIGAIQKGFIEQAEIECLLQSRKETVEVVLTGRSAPDWLIEQVDLVSEIQAVKHYLQDGVTARAGIEY